MKLEIIKKNFKNKKQTMKDNFKWFKNIKI